ncbi:MAG TPA: winged helix-turn-helix domain-containing protein [Casimicrobiaceae bacterium]|jgi:predicted ATPase/DNA-binding winged helix-turn-helix (wHTH) protein
MTAAAFQPVVTFHGGRVRVDRNARVVLVDGTPAKLGGRAFDLLDTLMQRHDRVVPKQELLDVVWPGLIVEENNLQVQVMALRKLLGADAIITVAGRGYQFRLTQDQAPVPEIRPETAPSAVGGLFGRDDLIASVCALLRRDGVRLVTLSGAGGVGKTRVGLRVTAELAHDFADGSYIVMLAAVRDAARLAATIAGVLNVQEAGNKAYADLLIAYLRDRSVLVTLDNFEHVLSAAPLVTALLEQCPRLKILVTSRVVLRVALERDMSVPPLAVPAARASAAQALETPAMRLLAARASDAGRAIGDEPANIAAAIDICRQLDGLPLAIELAAARLRVLTPPALAQRLASRLSLLRGGAADAPQRHRSLRDTIAWSYGLLSADEQRVFQRLAVFVGGWTLDAAEAVAGQAGLSQSLLDLLSCLIDNSLVQRTDDVADDARFAMLETVREFATEQFESGGEADALRARHADYFVEFAERADAKLRSGGRGPWLARFKAEYGNLRAALSWLVIERRDAPSALRLTGALAWFWYFTGQFSEGRGWIRLALALPGTEAPSEARAKVLSGESRLAMYSGAHAEGIAAAIQSVDLFRMVGDRAGLALALFHLGGAHSIPGQHELAIPAWDEAIRIFRELDDAWGVAVVTSYYGAALSLTRGKEDAGRAWMLEGRARCQALGDDWASTVSSHYLGSLALRQGDYAMARNLTEEMLISARELGDNFRVSRNLHQLAEIAIAQQQLDEARRHLSSSIALSREQGRLGDVAVHLRLLASIDAAQARPERAVRIYAAASRLEGHGTSIPTADPARHERVRDELRAQVGDRAYEAEWSVGAAMSVDQAIALAVSSPFI